MPVVRKRRTQAERSALSDRRIAKAAISLVAKQGYSQTSLAQIGKQAGYTGGLVSHRFGSKQRLLKDLLERITCKFWEDQIDPAVAGRTGLAALCAACDAYLAELGMREQNIRALYVLMGEGLGPLAEIRPILADLDEGLRVTVRKWLEQAVAAGEARRDLDCAATAPLIVGWLRGIALQWLMAPGCFDLQVARDGVTALLRRSVT
jgi:AcrR family transcriptional regulator